MPPPRPPPLPPPPPKPSKQPGTPMTPAARSGGNAPAGLMAALRKGTQLRATPSAATPGSSSGGVGSGSLLGGASLLAALSSVKLRPSHTHILPGEARSPGKIGSPASGLVAQLTSAMARRRSSIGAKGDGSDASSDSDERSEVSEDTASEEDEERGPLEPGGSRADGSDDDEWAA